MSEPLVVASYTNGEGEQVTIEQVADGAFAGQYLLVIHDDPPVGTKAPMLLDLGTAGWLLDWLLDAHGSGLFDRRSA